MDPGTLLATTHEAGDGLRVRLRLTRPSDGGRVRAFLEGLSPETRRRGLTAAVPQITEALVRRLTYYDPRERLVVAATAPLEGGERIVGLAEVALPGAGPADFALAVEDRLRDARLGELLSEVAAALAAQQGAVSLRRRAA